MSAAKEEIMNERTDSVAMPPPPESMLRKSLKIAAVVASYWTVSITLVFVNKYLLSSPELKLDAPLFVTWFQCLVALVLCAILGYASKLFPNLFSFPAFKIDIKVSREVLPLSIVFVLMIAFNNLCLKHVGVAFYYIGRSLTTVFNVIFSYLILKQSTSWKAVSCCGLIIGGFAMGVDQEELTGSLSLTGVVYGIAASASVAMYSIFIKRVLPRVDNNVWRLTLYNNFNALFLFFPFMLVSETYSIMYFESLFVPTFWLVMFVSGAFGFALGYLTGLQVQVTSPLTHTISGTAKACAQTVMATAYYMDYKPFMWWLSNGVVLFGSTAYTLVKRLEMKTDSEKTKSPSAAEIGELNEKLTLSIKS